MSIGNIYFKQGSKEDYELLEVKDNNTIYFLNDTKELYKGTERFSSGDIASILKDGLMSKEDKEELDRIILAIPELENTIEEHSQDISSLNSSIQDIEHDVSSIESSVNEIENDINTSVLTEIDSSYLNNKIIINFDKKNIKSKNKSSGSCEAILPVATSSNDGLMSKEDKTTLEFIRNNMSSSFRFCGSVQSISNLPVSGEQNDTYFVEDVACTYTWNGNYWYRSSADINDYENAVGPVIQKNMANKYSLDFSYKSGDTVFVTSEDTNKIDCINKTFQCISDYEEGEHGSFDSLFSKWTPVRLSDIAEESSFAYDLLSNVTVDPSSGHEYTSLQLQTQAPDIGSLKSRNCYKIEITADDVDANNNINIYSWDFKTFNSSYSNVDTLATNEVFYRGETKTYLYRPSVESGIIGIWRSARYGYVFTYRVYMIPSSSEERYLESNLKSLESNVDILQQICQENNSELSEMCGNIYTKTTGIAEYTYVGDVNIQHNKKYKIKITAHDAGTYTFKFTEVAQAGHDIYPYIATSDAFEENETKIYYYYTQENSNYNYIHRVPHDSSVEYEICEILNVDVIDNKLSSIDSNLISLSSDVNASFGTKYFATADENNPYQYTAIKDSSGNDVVLQKGYKYKISITAKSPCTCSFALSPTYGHGSIGTLAYNVTFLENETKVFYFNYSKESQEDGASYIFRTPYRTGESPNYTYYYFDYEIQAVPYVENSNTYYINKDLKELNKEFIETGDFSIQVEGVTNSQYTPLLDSEVYSASATQSNNSQYSRIYDSNGNGAVLENGNYYSTVVSMETGGTYNFCFNTTGDVTGDLDVNITTSNVFSNNQVKSIGVYLYKFNDSAFPKGIRYIKREVANADYRDRYCAYTIRKIHRLSANRKYRVEITSNQTCTDMRFRFCTSAGGNSNKFANTDIANGVSFSKGETKVFYFYDNSADGAGYIYRNPYASNSFSYKVSSIPCLEADNDYTEIPTYYKEYIEKKSDEIGDVLRSSGFSGDSFIFLTDYHRPKNAVKSPALVKYLFKNTPVHFMVFGGDTQDEPKSFESALHGITNYRGDFYDSYEKIYNILGNHEKIRISGSEAYSIMSKDKEFLFKSMSSCGDYYMDNKVQKIRYYFIGMMGSHDSIANESLVWFFNSLLDVPSEFEIIVFIHGSFLYYKAGHKFNIDEHGVTHVGQALDTLNSRSIYTYDGNSYDYSNSNSTGLFIVGGHCHYDYDSRCSNIIITGSTYKVDIPFISTTTDSTNQHNFGDTEESYIKASNPWTLISRTYGTTTEQAFDVINYDKQSKDVYFKRIGAGVDRLYHFLRRPLVNNLETIYPTTVNNNGIDSDKIICTYDDNNTGITANVSTYSSVRYLNTVGIPAQFVGTGTYGTQWTFTWKLNGTGDSITTLNLQSIYGITISGISGGDTSVEQTVYINTKLNQFDINWYSNIPGLATVSSDIVCDMDDNNTGVSADILFNKTTYNSKVCGDLRFVGTGVNNGDWSFNWTLRGKDINLSDYGISLSNLNVPQEVVENPIIYIDVKLVGVVTSDPSAITEANLGRVSIRAVYSQTQNNTTVYGTSELWDMLVQQE